jgi:NADH:ubiquinone oxidoreductase subunit 6 (subunit J)
MAVAQVLVYMGAISVLILFAIMITQSKAGPGRLVFQRQWWAGAIAAVVLVALMLVAILLTTWPLAGDEIVPQSARDIARLLFGDYLFAFEVVGVLLLAAVIGGLYLARRDPDMPETNRLVRPADDEEGV